MSRKPRLTEKEKGKIDLLSSDKLSCREIGKKIKRSHTVVANYLKLKDNYGLKGNQGRVSKLTRLTKKKIIHLASEELMSASKIKHDGIRYFWHDLRKEPKTFSKRQFGGGSVMIWGAFVNGTIFELHIMNGIYDSVKYTDMLEECLDPFMQPDWIFMQDGASIHMSKHTKK